MSTIRLSMIGLGSRVLVLALTFASSILIARAVGPAGMGEYFVVLTTGALIATFCDFGLSSSAVVFAGERKHPLHVIGFLLFGVAVLVPLTLSLLVHAVYPSPAIWGHSLIATIAAIALGPMTLYNNYWTFLLVGRKEIAVSNGLQLTTYVVFTVALIVLRAMHRLTVEQLIVLHLITFGAQMLLQVLLLMRWKSRDAATPSEPVALLGEMARFGLPAYPSTVSSMFTLRIGILMLSSFHGAAASGVYSLAFQVADKLQLVTRSIQDAIYDNMIVLKGQAAVDALNRYLRLSLLVVGAIGAAGILAAPFGIRLFYGRAFAGSIVPFQILIAGSVAYGMAALLSTYFVGQIKRPSILSVIAVLSAIVAVIANRLLVPPYAAVGAAAALLISQLSILIACLLTYRTFSRTDLRSALLVSMEDVRDIRARAAVWLAGSGPQ
jgi:O-antigen/teichoic acid export membrane protein